MSTDRPMVSVVIPCFNAERWIGDTIESIYRQTWRAIELVVVNDGSTDGSLAEIERQKSPMLTTIDQRNLGQSAAFNVALKRCNGFFVQFLDADDGLAPAKIERQVRALGDTVGAVATSSWRSSRARPGFPSKMSRGHERCEDADGTGGLACRNLARRGRDDVSRNVAGAGAWSIAWVAGPKNSPCVDTEYFTRLVLSSSAVISCPDALCYYRRSHQSVSGLRTPAPGSPAFAQSISPRTCFSLRRRPIAREESHPSFGSDLPMPAFRMTAPWEPKRNGGLEYFTMNNCSVRRAHLQLDHIYPWMEGRAIIASLVRRR